MGEKLEITSKVYLSLLEKRIVEILSDPSVFPWWDKYDRKAGSFVYELVADYRDVISGDTVAKILSKTENGDLFASFVSQIDEWWQQGRWENEDSIVNRVISVLSNDSSCSNGFSEDEESLIRDVVLNHVSVVPPYDHYLKQEVCVNIFMDTGDGNFDYVCNHMYPAYNGNYDQEPHDAASILWLTHQQGYTKQLLWDALRGGDKKYSNGFLESCRVEVANEGSHMNTLAFLVKMTMQQLIDLNDLILLQEQEGHFYDPNQNPVDCGTITLDKRTECGLYDPWNGGGSLLEIQLEKDVEIPVKFIRSALPDGGDGYAIHSVYGVDDGLWHDTLKSVRDPRINTKEVSA